jgi:D-alanine-D-alanine ligase
MERLRIGLLRKERGNFALQRRYVRTGVVVDETGTEVEHHTEALIEAGHTVCVVSRGPEFISSVENVDADLIFNVSSIVEAAILQVLELPTSDPARSP